VLAGDPKGAIPVLEDLVSGTHGEPKFEWYRGLVSACLQAEEPEVGKTAVDQMLERFGTNPNAWYLSFQFAASTSDYHQAAVSLTVVGYLRSLTRQEQLQLGDLYAAIEAPAAAANYYSNATQDTATVVALGRLARDGEPVRPSGYRVHGMHPALPGRTATTPHAGLLSARAKSPR